MIQTANKYGTARPVQTPGRKAPPRTRALWTPTARGAAQRLRDWIHRELKEGGYLHTYLRREKHRMPEMIRWVSRFMAGFQQNPQSSFRRLGTIPARLYHRWKEEDRHFFEDDANWRSLKRDNPDLPVYVDPRPLPRGRFCKVYPATARPT